MCKISNPYSFFKVYEEETQHRLTSSSFTRDSLPIAVIDLLENSSSQKFASSYPNAFMIAKAKQASESVLHNLSLNSSNSRSSSPTKIKITPKKITVKSLDKKSKNNLKTDKEKLEFILNSENRDVSLKKQIEFLSSSEEGYKHIDSFINKQLNEKLKQAFDNNTFEYVVTITELYEILDDVNYHNYGLLETHSRIYFTIIENKISKLLNNGKKLENFVGDLINETSDIADLYDKSEHYDLLKVELYNIFEKYDLNKNDLDRLIKENEF